MKEGETGEWVLLDGTPASCANIALHNLYKGEIDLVVRVKMRSHAYMTYSIAA